VAHRKKDQTDLLGLHRQTVELDRDLLPPFDHHYNSAIFQMDGHPYIVMRCHNNNPPDADEHFWHNAKRSQIWVARLDEVTLQPAWYKKLDIPLPNCEDPRAVVHEGKLYVFFTTCSPPPAKADHTFQVAVFDKRFELLEQHPITLNCAARVEKNWTFFVDENGQWKCVYMINPWEIMAFDENWNGIKTETAAIIYDWIYGVMRGGTCPVMVDGAYFTWFHAVKHDALVNMRVYTAGLIAFDAKAPHLPIGISQCPLISPKLSDVTWVKHARVVFPCGAIFLPASRQWLVSYGYGDHTTRIERLWHDELFGPALWRPAEVFASWSHRDALSPETWR
jgi:predicted GH43/DUF377 family glycosyl hydrolase